VATPAAEIGLLRFGVFELDLRRQELRRAGVLIKLTPQQFRVLRMLVEACGQVCTREAIQREIWGNEVYVDFDRSLNVCIAAIRSALNDDSEASRFIQTVPRQGYRFVAPVEGVGPSAPPAKPNTRRWVLAATCALVLALAIWRITSADRSLRLAVLPFENLTGEMADRTTALGLTDELTSQLGAANPGRLAVIGRTSASRYAATKADLPLDYLVEGSLRSESGQVRIAVRLVEARGQTQIWNHMFQAEGQGKLALQQSVAMTVTREVAARLFPHSAPAAAPAYAADPQAAEAYWNGRYLDRTNPARALEWFEQAARGDAGFAAPRAAIAEAWLGRALAGSDPRDAFAKSRAAAEEALRIDPNNAEAHAVLGAVLFWDAWNRAESRRHLERALALNASLARARHDYAFLLVETGAPDAGIQELRTAISLDPLAPRVNLDAGWIFLQARRFDEAVRYATRALELEPRMVEARLCIARARIYQGHGTPADLEALTKSDNPYYRAMGAAMAGQAAQAMAALDEAFGKHSSMLAMLGTEPAFDSLRNDLRFREMERKVGLALL
jgi:DNA-binding winged helix-turn-helix (wHTH) protein/TolB-like protein/Tfp pilus assembly protein PilF